MSNCCGNCNHNEEGICSLIGNNYKTKPEGLCPGYKPKVYTNELGFEVWDDDPVPVAEPTKSVAEPVKAKPVAAKPKISKSVKAVTGPIETDYAEEEKQVKLFEHQKLARNKFKDLDEIALFFEMGCGKSVTSLSIMIDKYKEGKIDSLLIVAPNDVHKQWFDDLCNDDALLSRILEQEHVPCTGQIIGGRGGQKQFYDFEDDGKLHIVCVNIDTFSQPHKWEVIVD